MKTYQTEQVKKYSLDILMQIQKFRVALQISEAIAKELLSLLKFREDTSYNHPQETILLASLFTLNKAVFCEFTRLL